MELIETYKGKGIYQEPNGLYWIKVYMTGVTLYSLSQDRAYIDDMESSGRLYEMPSVSEMSSQDSFDTFISQAQAIAPESSLTYEQMYGTKAAKVIEKSKLIIFLPFILLVLILIYIFKGGK